MFSSVLVGLKEGVHRPPLLELAKSVAPTSVHLLTLIRVGTEEDELQRLRAAETDLRSAAEGLQVDGIAATYEAGVVAVAAASDIIRIARDRKADLIVIGLAKRTRVGKALLGSDAQRVLLSAPCPVLVTRSET